MSNAIDLCTVQQVRSRLGIQQTAQAGNVVPPILTTSGPITAGTNVVVTPVSMAGIQVGTILAADSGLNLEYVVVSAITSTTFTANFSLNHTASTVQIYDKTDEVLGEVITGFSAYVLWRTGRGNSDGSMPTQSPFITPVAYNEWYDGNGNLELFLRNYPIQSVAALAVNGVSVPASTGATNYGYVISEGKKSLVIRSSWGGNFPYGYGTSIYYRSYPQAGYFFAPGVQNVNVQYTAGFSTTPYDLMEACVRMACTNYKRYSWLDLASEMKGDTLGTIKYRDWELDPHTESIIENYARRAAV